jgi:hypothetical protein
MTAAVVLPVAKEIWRLAHTLDSCRSLGTGTVNPDGRFCVSLYGIPAEAGRAAVKQEPHRGSAWGQERRSGLNVSSICTMAGAALQAALQSTIQGLIWIPS